jgi:RNA-binding protein
MPGLSPTRRRELTARAHALDPVALIGGAGLSPAVLAEIDRALKNHELIKVRVPGADRPGREAILEEICARTGAQAVQHIGKILVIFRQNPEPEESRQEINARSNVRRRR